MGDHLVPYQGWVAWTRVMYGWKRDGGWRVWASHPKPDILLARLATYLARHGGKPDDKDYISGVMLKVGETPYAPKSGSAIEAGEMPDGEWYDWNGSV